MNDDDSFFVPATSPSGERRIHSTAIGSATDCIILPTYYYPFMHRTLETLGRIVASSSNVANSSVIKSKIMTLGSAVALGRFSAYEKERETGTATVLDAKLFSFAICQLSECFDSVLSGDGSNAERSLSISSSAVTTPVAIPSSVIGTYRLNDPLVITRNNPSETAAAESSSSSYGGAFLLDDKMRDRTVSFADSDKRSFRVAVPMSSDSLGGSVQADILSLYIRAQISPNVHCDSGSSNSTTVCDAAMSSLLQSLLAIIGMSYNFSLKMRGQGGDNCIGAELSFYKKKSTVSKKKNRRASDSAPSFLEMSGQERAQRLVGMECCFDSSL